VGSHVELGETDVRILAVVAPSGASVAAIAEQLSLPEATARTSVVRLVQADLLRVADDDQLRPTHRGLMVANQVRQPGRVASSTALPVDLTAVAQLVSDWWPSHAARTAAEDAELDGLLSSDEERDSVVQRLAEAFAQGRISSTELDERTGRALAARTRGDLDDVLAGLGGLERSVARHPVRKATFGVVAFCCSPFVLFGAMFLAFGQDGGDHVFGLVLLILLLPGLLALWRWAWPRRRGAV
jgi:DNA-binding IclR family transcriptional regulator